MYNIGLLLLIGPIRLIVESISHYLKFANRSVLQRLYVKLEPEFSKPALKSEIFNVSRLSSVVPIVYNQATTICSSLDVRVVLSDLRLLKTGGNEWSKIDVVLTNSNEENQNILDYVGNMLTQNCKNIVKINHLTSFTDPNLYSPSCYFNVYDTVCLGGTFDRLHNGHKVLLSEAVLRSREKLIVGVTDGPMLKRKKLWELIEPVEKRICDVTNFLCDVDPSLGYEVISIIDPYGPTITNPNIECLVVSAETKAGGDRVNAERLKRGLKALDLYVVDLVESIHKDDEDERKLSSSTIRMELLGVSRNKYQMVAEHSGDFYCIVLKGLPMSGKTKVVDFFKASGICTVNCSDVFYSLICEDIGLKQNLIHLFSRKLEDENGSLNYESLIAECLKSREKRQNLVNILCEKLRSAVKKKILLYQEQGKELVIIEDSIFDISLKCDVNEIWVSILPVAENLKKLQDFYGLTEEESIEVMSSLPSNEELVKNANIIFCDQCPLNSIETQMKNAMSYLQKVLKRSKM